MSVRAPSNGFSGKDLPPVERPGAPSSSNPRPSIGWMIGGSVALAAGLELFGRYLYKAHGVGYGVTGTLTLLATVVWGASAVHVIRRAHGAPHATRALFVGACLIVLSQATSMGEYFQLPGVAFLMQAARPVPPAIEEGSFIVGLALVFLAFYLSVLEADAANSRLQRERETLAGEVAERGRAEEALRQAYDKTEQRVEERTASLREANKRLSEEIEERRRFEQALRQREEEARTFLEQLRSLHEVSAELARVAEEGSFDDLCRHAIELGQANLDFERLGLWFQAAATNEVFGSFGIDESGCVRDERLVRRKMLGPETAMGKILAGKDPSGAHPDMPIYDLEENVIGRGWSAHAVLWDGAEVLGFIGTDTFLTGRPITDRQWEILTLYATMIANLCRIKRTEQALRASEERYRGLIEGLSEAVYRLTLPDGRYEYMGSAARDVFGHSAEQFMSKPRYIYDIIHPDSAAYVEDMWNRLIRGEMPSTYEYRIIDPEGNERWILQSNTLIRNEAGVAVAIEGICRNVTEEKQAHQLIEEQRARFLDSAKMSVLGEMASNVAHEINNPLAIVSGSAEQLQNLLQQDPMPAEHVPRLTDTIVRNVSRIQTIVKGLRTFARKGEDDPFQETPLKVIVDDTVVLCQDRFLSHRVALTVEEIPEGMTVECRPTQVMEVLFNLLSNALHAVEVSNEKWVAIAVRDEGMDVVLSVTDSGCGVPPEVAKTMFDRFVTSKEFGKGIGLGLSISKRIVLTHNGSLTLDTTCPNTRFVVRLPKRQPTLADGIKSSTEGNDPARPAGL